MTHRGNELWGFVPFTHVDIEKFRRISRTAAAVLQPPTRFELCRNESKPYGKLGVIDTVGLCRARRRPLL